MLDMSTGSRMHAHEVRGADLYETPAVAIRALMRIETLPSLIYEPAVGKGAIARELVAAGHTVFGTDLIDYGWKDEPYPVKGGVDFLMLHSADLLDDVDAIVTNPPFQAAEEFVAKAIELCPRVYMLLRVAFLEGQRWEKTRGLADHFARMHVFTPRLPMMHRDGWEGPKSTSGMPFAWYVFERDHRKRYGPPRIHWCNWKDLKV